MFQCHLVKPTIRLQKLRVSTMLTKLRLTAQPQSAMPWVAILFRLEPNHYG